MTGGERVSLTRRGDGCFDVSRSEATYFRMVPLSEISREANDYNLNIPRYIDSSEPEDSHDLAAHLRGGIPNRDINALGAYWEVFLACGSCYPIL